MGPSLERVRSEIKDNHISRLIAFSLIATASTLILSWLLFTYFVGFNISHDSGDWNDLGSFLGGVGGAIAPVLTLTSILFVWKQSMSSAKIASDQIRLLENQIRIQSHDSFLTTFRAGLDSLQNNLDRHVYDWSPELDGKITIKDFIDREVDIDFSKKKEPPVVSMYWPHISRVVSEVYFLLDLLLKKNGEDSSIDIEPYYDLVFATMECSDSLKDIAIGLCKYDDYCKYPSVKEYLSGFWSLNNRIDN